MKYTLIDGVVRATLHPKTFEVPNAEEKAAVKPGDHVKLGFEESAGTERMWVKVTGPGAGTLDNGPVFLKSIKWNDPVSFEPQHILSILPAEVTDAKESTCK